MKDHFSKLVRDKIPDIMDDIFRGIGAVDQHRRAAHGGCFAHHQLRSARA